MFASRPDFPRLLAKLGYLVGRKADQRRRLGSELTLKALEMAPADPEMRFLCEWALRRRVPSWHFPMVHDVARNTHYQSALEQ